MRRLAVLCSVAWALSLAACGSSSSTKIDATPGGGDGGTGADAPVTTDGGTSGLTLQYPDITVAAGAENTQCVVVNLHNATSLHIHEVHNTLSQMSHHLIVYTTNDTTEQPVPFNCQPFTDTLNPAKGAPIMVSQKKDDDLVLPTGVGFTFAANQMIRLEMHYINTTDADMTANATIRFTAMPDAEFTDEAGFLFIGDPDINIPPMSTLTVGPVFFPLPSDYNNVNFFDITGHEHHLGTNVKIWTGPGAGGPFTSVYDIPGWDWSSPATQFFNPAFQVPAGGGFQFQCDYNNTTMSTVKFGESALDEMCFFWTYYYPNKGAKVCFHTDQLPGGFNSCCPGGLGCNMLGGP